MKAIYDKTGSLINTIKGSKYYENYQQCLFQLKKEKEAYKEFNQFRKQYFDLTQTGEDNFAEIEKLQQKFHETLSNASVVDFMEAEDQMCLILKDMYIMIAEQLQFDMDFIEEEQ